jgi:predicted dehydrogenase
MTRLSTRRDFLQQTTLAGLGVWVAAGTSPSQQRSPNERLNIAIIGTGGRGGHNLGQMAGENIVALCDVDERRLGPAGERFPRARRYQDFRRLYDQVNDIDAVVVSTTEHTHAFATLPALRLGKHVYCEKPLAHSVHEARVVAQAAARARVVTQMGTQIHASENYRRVVELVQANAIGPVRECHVWVARGGPQWGGGDRPQGTHAVPSQLNWELWLGPAPQRPYHPDYVPGPSWYKWWDFGGGVLPDLGSHWNDLPFWALRLRHPSTVEAEGPPVHPETAPPELTVRWEFPARGELPPVRLAWYHGGRKPEAVMQRRVPDWASGALFVGERGMLLSDYNRHVLLPEQQFADYRRPAPSIPRSLGHHQEWIQACKTGGPTTCPFDYSGALTESNILGNVAYRLGRRLEWDATNLHARNCPEAERLLRTEYRAGWSLT